MHAEMAIALQLQGFCVFLMHATIALAGHSAGLKLSNASPATNQKYQNTTSSSSFCCKSEACMAFLGVHTTCQNKNWHLFTKCIHRSAGLPALPLACKEYSLIERPRLLKRLDSCQLFGQPIMLENVPLTRCTDPGRHKLLCASVGMP